MKSSSLGFRSSSPVSFLPVRAIRLISLSILLLLSSQVQAGSNPSVAFLHNPSIPITILPFTTSESSSSSSSSLIGTNHAPLFLVSGRSKDEPFPLRIRSTTESTRKLPITNDNNNHIVASIIALHLSTTSTATATTTSSDSIENTTPNLNLQGLQQQQLQKKYYFISFTNNNNAEKDIIDSSLATMEGIGLGTSVLSTSKSSSSSSSKSGSASDAPTTADCMELQYKRKYETTKSSGGHRNNGTDSNTSDFAAATTASASSTSSSEPDERYWQLIAEKAFDYNETTPIFLFDGICNFCNAGVHFCMDLDTDKSLRYASLHSLTGKALLVSNGLQSNDTSTLVYVVSPTEAYYKSDAVLRIIEQLHGIPVIVRYASVLCRFLLPTVLRDAIYQVVSTNRHRFGSADGDSCRLDLDPTRFVEDPEYSI